MNWINLNLKDKSGNVYCTPDKIAFIKQVGVGLGCEVHFIGGSSVEVSQDASQIKTIIDNYESVHGKATSGQ